MQSSARAMQEPCRCERTGRTREGLTLRDVCSRGAYAGCRQGKGGCKTHSRDAMRRCGPIVRTNERRNGCEVKYLVGGDCWRMNCLCVPVRRRFGFLSLLGSSQDRCGVVHHGVQIGTSRAEQYQTAHADAESTSRRSLGLQAQLESPRAWQARKPT